MIRYSASALRQGHKAKVVREPPRPAPPPTSPLGVLARALSEAFDVVEADLFSASQLAKAAIPRQVGMYLLRKHMNYTYSQAGLAFGRCSGTSVLKRAVERTTERMRDPDFASRVEKVRRAIEANTFPSSRDLSTYGATNTCSAQDSSAYTGRPLNNGVA